MEEKISGLLLQAIPYLGRKKIFKIFTPDGLLSLFAKSSSLSPFCIAEWVYLKTVNEIYPLKDTSLIDPLLQLRQNYATLTAAGSIARDLLRSQLPNKKAPELYQLACLYLQRLPSAPHILPSSFRLKLLAYEGLLSSEREPSFTPFEWEQVSLLAFTRQLAPLYQLTSIPTEKIALLFEERLIRN